MEAWNNDGEINVVLSRRNLRSLLAKLDGAPMHSACQIMRETELGLVIVTAEEDDTHYEGRTPGPVHPDTEGVLRES